MIKRHLSESYNWIFDDKTGCFIRWGKNKNDNPFYSPIGPEILDIEISTICHGTTGPCTHCYKSNTPKGKYMSTATFKNIIDKFPKNLTQIALGIGDIDSNPDLEEILKYSREKNIVPNITINGTRMTDYYYDILTKYCGAVAISYYNDLDLCYNAIRKLNEKGLKQINIHMLLSKETYLECFNLMMNNEPGKEFVNAIIFLMLKPKGNRNDYHSINQSDFNSLVKYALQHNINMGFDSCSAPYFLNSVKDHKQFEEFKMKCEGCESTLFSYYVNVDGKGFPCSFTEEENEGIDLLKIKDFLEDVWFNDKTKSFRNQLINQEDFEFRRCPKYVLVNYNKKEGKK